MDIDNENYLVKGRYVTVSGIVKRVDPIINKIIIIEDIKILIEDILHI